MYLQTDSQNITLILLSHTVQAYKPQSQFDVQTKLEQKSRFTQSLILYGSFYYVYPMIHSKRTLSLYKSISGGSFTARGPNPARKINFWANRELFPQDINYN